MKGVSGSKQNNNATYLKQNFLSRIHERSSSNHIYTDGSKSQNGVGFGFVFGKNLDKYIHSTLPTEATLFIVELQAIGAVLSY